MQRLQRQENVGLQIAAARRCIKQAVGELGRPFHLSPQRFWLLLGIREREGLSLCELAGQLRVDEPTASRTVNALVRQGLVRIVADPEDRRRSHLLLTATGKDLAESVQPLADGLRAATVEGFSAAERRALSAALRRVVENVARFTRERRNGRPAAGAER